MRVRRLTPDPAEVQLDSLRDALTPPPSPMPGRPHVRADMVTSLDGRAAIQGRSGGLGTPADKAMFMLLRQTVDCVLVGANTVRQEGYGAMKPLCAIVSGRLDLPLDSGLFTDPGSRVAIYTAAPGPLAHEPADVTVHCIPREALTVEAVLQSLHADYGVQSVLCEGGPSLFGQLVRGGVLDELFLTVSPKLVGGDELGIMRGPSPDVPAELDLEWVLAGDASELLLRYRR